MRKRNVNFLADTIFWYLIYFLPVVAWLIYLFAEPSSSTTLVDFGTFMSNIGFGFVNDNIIISSLSGLFGANGVLPIFSSSTPLLIFTWFICAIICHLAVDFLVFIPRLAHKWLNAFTTRE